MSDDRSQDNQDNGRDSANGPDIKAIREKVNLAATKDESSTREFVQTGADIKNIREKAGLSQREFAALLCISKRTLEGWEQGHRTLNGPARALLTIFKNDPENAIKALHGAK